MVDPENLRGVRGPASVTLAELGSYRLHQLQERRGVRRGVNQAIVGRDAFLGGPAATQAT